MTDGKHQLPPIPPNMGLENYDWFWPLWDIADAIRRYKKGARATDKEMESSEPWVRKLILKGREKHG